MDDTSDGPMVIFGGRSEIGIELAQRLAPGATVVLAARSADRLSEQVAALEKAGAAKVDVREFDADDLASHAPLVASIVADHGRLGTAVLAFGVLGDQARAEKDPAHAAAVLHTDFVAQASLLTVLANTMRSAGTGAIVVFSSVAGVRVRRANYVYGSAKAGLDGFCSGLSDALHGSGRAAAARPARLRHRPDDRGHETGTHVEHAAAGRRRHRKGAGQAPQECVDSLDTATVLRRDAAAAALRVAEDAAMSACAKSRGLRWIIVVGIGADGTTGLAPTLDELRRAAVIFGSGRQLGLLDDSVGATGASGRRRCCPPCTPCSTVSRATCTWSPAVTRCCTGSAIL